MAENATAVTDIDAIDEDAGQTLTYSIVGGVDRNLFQIDAAGALSFIAAPNFEAPADADGDNVYDVVLQVSDGTLTDTPGSRRHRHRCQRRAGDHRAQWRR